ncbi:NirA-like nitrate assimilation regulatory protein [Fusarium heterosporum]|uniref:Pyruvate decarboxylase n=1 Tax=Fusarium heterosporum TaxID=42747 RepID=A0A8H5U093_FUSHE|nr:NirA-like nitrate assimilation regulatory protein [Fusarium heterosporum]
MDHLQQNLQTDLFDKLKEALADARLHQIGNPIVCLRAFIQDGDSADDDSGTYETNRQRRKEGFLFSHCISISHNITLDTESVVVPSSDRCEPSPTQTQPDSDHSRAENVAVTGNPTNTDLVSRKRKGGLRLALSSDSVSIDDDSSSRRQIQVKQDNFPKRTKPNPDGVFHAQESSLSKFIVGVWEQIHSGLTLEPLVLSEQVNLDAPTKANHDLSLPSLAVARGTQGQVNTTTESFSQSNLFCRRVTQASRTCRSIEVIVQARWVELFDSYVEYLGNTNPELSSTKTRMRALAEACTDFGWSEKELRNKMAIWRGYKEIKDALGWAALVFSGMGLYRLCKYRIGFDVEKFYRARALRLQIEVAADTLHPNWRHLLAIVGESTQRAFTGHPHDWVVHQNGSDPVPLRATYLEWDPQFAFEHIDESALDTKAWGADDPRWIPPPNAAVCITNSIICDVCGQIQSNEPATNACKCFASLFGGQRLPSAVQVFRTSNGRNNGLQALVPFERGVAIGEFLGLVTKGIEDQDVLDNEAGTRHVYGVPGDFTLKALDHLPRSGLQFVGCCNELNAGYVADGYARSQRHRLGTGLGALMTTYGVGELSAANAIAGSYAEYLPVVHIVGSPSQKARSVSAASIGGKKPHRHIHHTLADSRIGVYREIAEKFTVAQLDLATTEPERVPSQVDWVLSQALRQSRPVYIELPSDVVEIAVPAQALERPLDQGSSSVDRFQSKHTKEKAQQLLHKLHVAQRPFILVDRGDGIEIARHKINELARRSGIPTASLPSGASMVDNSLPNYFGVYSGPIGTVDLTSAVRSADLVLAFGCQLSDTQTLGWSVLPERKNMVIMGRNDIEGEEADVEGVVEEMIQTLDKSNLQSQDTSSWGNFRLQPPQILNPEAPINQDEFYIHLSEHLQKDDTVLLGNATPIIGGRDFVLPQFSQLIASGMWFSIGHMLPAALGVSQAKASENSKGRTILLEGDGSFQMTAQELSTIIHKRANMAIFIINNAGYTYERYIHGMDKEYNDVAPWNYSAAPQLFGQPPEGYPIQSYRVETCKDLEPLLPQPSDGPGEALPHVLVNKLAPTSRKNRVVSACQPCKLKKVRCDGIRPECNVCHQRGRNCVYPVEISKVEGLVKRQKALQENVESFVTLYQHLQDKPSSEANALFERIRNGLGIDAALEFVKAKDNSSALAFRDPPSARVEWSQQIHDCNLLFESELLPTEISDVAVQALRDGVDCYFSYLGTMFPIYSRPEVDSIIDTFLSTQSSSQGSSSEQSVDRKVAYGELLAVCALGFQYDRQTLPNGNSSICTPFYHKARLFLDHVVEKEPLRAMRMCCCLGIYNVIAKSSLAVSYTDWGILLGSSSGLRMEKKPPGLSETEFQGYLKTFRALITIRSWVTATLGHIPSPEITRCIHETKDQIDNAAFDCTENAVTNTIQQKMAQITVLKANILRTVASFRTLSPVILGQMHSDLERWRTSLPYCLRLETLMESSSISPEQRRVAFYMHLFYMSALILKARALLASPEQAAPNEDSQSRFTILEGVRAARSSVRLLGLFLDEKAVVKNCWLTIYQCYITFLALSYTSVKRFLVEGANTFQSQDTFLSAKCIEILALCATKDRIARSFHARLCKYQSILRELLPKSAYVMSKGVDSYDESAFGDSYLFVNISGHTELHNLMNELVEMLCYPLTLLKGSTDRIQYPTIVEASVKADISFAHHLASPFNMAEDELPEDLFPPGKSMQGGNEEEAEGYVSGSVPYGWDVSVWSQNSADGEVTEE